MQKRRLAFVVVLAVTSAASGCGVGAFGIGAGVAPPMRIDVAPVVMLRDGQADASMHLAGGVYWASGSPDPATPFDFGAGYGVDLPEAAPAPADAAMTAPGGQRQALRPSDEPDGGVLHGPFVEVSQSLGSGEHTRAWLGLKGELLFGGGADGLGVGLAVRSSWELIKALDSNDPSSQVMGALGIGVYAEAGIRALPSDEQAFQVTAGLSLRLPFVIGVRTQ